MRRMRWASRCATLRMGASVEGRRFRCSSLSASRGAASNRKIWARYGDIDVDAVADTALIASLPNCRGQRHDCIGNSLRRSADIDNADRVRRLNSSHSAPNHGIDESVDAQAMRVSLPNSFIERLNEIQRSLPRLAVEFDDPHLQTLARRTIRVRTLHVPARRAYDPPAGSAGARLDGFR